ncbi:MAG: alanine dehydrogenase [Bacteroidetes bacterium]|nr:MAG: alanine dehydrogenase [Bacteroidota bacterium]
MNEDIRGVRYTSFFAQESLAPQPETLAIDRSPSELFIGVPLEISAYENRVALVPHAVQSLIGNGHRVIVQHGAGEKSNYSDAQYSEAGAEMVPSAKEVYAADIIIKVAPPSVEELNMFHADQILVSPLQIPIISQEYIETLRKKRVIAVAMEYLQATDGSFPVVRIMSEIAGISAMHTAAELLSNAKGGRGVLLGGVSGVPPAKVVILGAGVVGEFATRTALGLGASVRIFDDDVYKLMRIQKLIGRQLHTSTINPVYLSYQLLSADCVIGAIHSREGRTPMVVSEEMVAKMKDGSVIIDVSIDQGGCFETSEVTSHKHPTFSKYGVVHYCVPNIPSKVSRTASVAVSNILTPLLVKAGGTGGLEQLLFRNPGIRHGVYTYKGCLTNMYLSKHFGIKFTDINLLLTSHL